MRKAYKHLVLLDKPAGITSHDAVQLVKKVYRAGRAGHCGTLDPAVTGLLIVALDEARKAMPVLMGLDKEYEGTMRLHSYRPEADIRGVFRKFTGTIIQTPPVRSRVKRVPRKRTVRSITLLSTDGRDVVFRVLCEAGTYIRKLVHDMGESMGCGAHMAALRRIAVGPFHHCMVAERLRENPTAYLVPLETALEKIGLKKIRVKERGMEKVSHGAPIGKGDMERSARANPGEIVGIYFRDRIIALGIKTKDGARPDRVLR